MIKKISVVLIAVWLLAGCAVKQSAQAGTQVIVSLKPMVINSATQGFDVEVTVHNHQFEAGKVSLYMPLVVTNVETVAGTVDDLHAEDDIGTVTFRSESDGYSRVWIASRDTQGSVMYRYTAALPENPGSLGVAPPIELRLEDASVSGGTGVFFLQPLIGPADYKFEWRLEHLEDTASGLSSLGMGNTGFTSFNSPADFSSTYVMGGQVSNYMSDNADFITAWQGEPPFSGLNLMQWGEALYAHYNDFFAIDNAATYVVFMRSNDVNPGGGMARGNSFIMTYDQNTELTSLKSTLSHEMFHTFLGGLQEPAGLESSWFSEGLAVFYQDLIPLRAGMTSAEDFLKGINQTAVRYYTNSKIDTPNDQIAEQFWLDTRVRVLPYDRGSLYFASLNHHLHQASDGEISLDDVLIYLRGRELEEGALTLDLWHEALFEFAGPDELARFKAVMDGATVELAPDTFGACFERYTDTFRRYELGFAPEALTEQPRQVRDLIPTSNAARAGLQEGDIITLPVPQDSIQGNQTALLTLSIERNGELSEITYLPRGESVEAWQWRVAAESCEEPL